MDHITKSGKKTNLSRINITLIYACLLILGITLGYFLRQNIDDPSSTEEKAQEADQVYSYKHAIRNAKDAAALSPKQK